MHSLISEHTMILKREGHTVYALLGHCHKITNAHVVVTFISYGNIVKSTQAVSLLGYKSRIM